MDHGQYEYRTSNNGISWIKWMDKKTVCFLSNYYDPCKLTITNRTQKDGSAKTINCPIMCSDYHKNMEYVDRSDHLVSTYKIDKNSKKLWHRIFWHFVDLTIINALIIYNTKNLEHTMKSINFRLLLVDQLVGNHFLTSKDRKRQEKSPFNVNSKPQVSIVKRRSQSAHMPLVSTTLRRCALCSIKAQPSRIKFSCSGCNVPLCIKEKQNCFYNYYA